MTYSQIETINRRVGLSLFQIPQGDDVEESILLSSFLLERFVEFQE